MKFSLLLACLAFTCATFAAEPATPPPSPVGAKHFLIVLKLVPRLYDQKAWTKEDRATVGAHFQRLKAGVAEGKVLLAGRTEEALEVTMGLIIFKAPNETAAREFMNGDPCVAAGVMTATLHPYGLALMAK
ncbi:YciI family protein [Oleiharenicola lentus]|uniref:YciI family protein n=1 Tax=Oleiharenicola lentus TaxID=2508720 RepID=UPI003F66FBC2